MHLKVIHGEFTICRLEELEPDILGRAFCFAARTDEELSLVCRTEDVPASALARSDGWRAFRINETLDFSLVGVLSAISGALAEKGIGIFAVSTYNTDYILTRKSDFDFALQVLRERGYMVECP